MDGGYITVEWVAGIAITLLAAVAGYLYRSDRASNTSRLAKLEQDMASKVAKQDLQDVEDRITDNIGLLRQQLENDMRRIEDTDIEKLRLDVAAMEQRIEQRISTHNNAVTTLIQQSAEATSQKFDLVVAMLRERG